MAIDTTLQANYLVVYRDEKNEEHTIPFAQSWFARAECVKLVKRGVEAYILAFDKKLKDYALAEDQMERVQAALPKNEGQVVSHIEYERLAELEMRVIALKRQAKKGNISTADFIAANTLFNELARLMGVDVNGEEDL